MIKSNKFKKLLISLLMIFAVLFIKASYSHAETWYFSDFSELESSSEFYCIEHGVPMTGGTWVSGSTEVVASDSARSRDRILAYILADAERTGDTGYHNNGDHQEAVWHWYSWLSVKDTYANYVYNDAVAAAQTIINSTNSAELETGNLTVIEDIASLPIEEITGKINKIEVQFKDPVSKQTYTQTITTGNSGVDEWIKVYSDESCKNSINIENIKKGNVYFKILKENYEIVDIKCNVKADQKGYIVTITNWQKDTEASSEQDLITADVTYGKNEKDVTIKAVYPTGKLRIVKVDKHFNEVRPDGAKFKIHSKIGWVVKLTDGTIIYTGSESEATEFATSKENNGQIDVVLRYGKYDVYETKAPIGYDITKQDGYMNNNGKDPYSFSQNNKWVYTGRADIYANTLNNNVLQYTVTNKKVVDKLRGRVWVDNPVGKETDYNYILDENGNDKLIAGIKVTLFDNNREIAVTTTDANGYYEFTSKNSSNYTGEDKNLYYWELARSYVEFTYDNKTYIVVDPFVGNNLKINSKAMEYQMTVDELKDENLTGTEGNLPGKATTYRNTTLTTPGQILANNDDPKDLKTTPLTGYYNNETYTVDDINLGIKEKHDPDYKISENLEYVKVKMKGYTYTYKYGDPEVTNSQFVPRVSKQNSKHTFTAAIYPTDIAYNIATPGNGDDELKVYVVYSIGVKNTEIKNSDDTYVEQRLYLDSLNNNYDTNRYMLSKEEIGNSKEENEQFKLWDEDNGTVSYNVNADNNAFKDGIAPNETKTSYIQFRVKEDTLEKMLKGTLDGTESASSVATAMAHHEYLRTDDVWYDDANVIAFDGVKGTGYPRTNASNEKYYVHKSLSKDDMSSSLFIDLKISESRKLSGIVFEDFVTEESKTNNTSLGNGTLDDGEINRASKVKVELLNEDKNVSKLYKKDGSLEDAVLDTEKEGGTYKFDGVVPGYYYIRFTYGNGEQLMMPANEAIKSKDYRSTIVNNSYIETAMEANAEYLKAAQKALVKDYNNEEAEEAKKLVEWYKYLDKDYSTAIDDLGQREKINRYIYKDDGNVYDPDGNPTDANGNKITDVMNINSYTPMIGISIENNIKNETEDYAGTDHKNEFTGFNFGLIKQPNTDLKLEKKITNVKFTNQAGSTLVSENPASKESTYLTALDKIEGGSKYAKLETEPEQIYGSSIEVTYEITITNDSPIDYIDDSYYKYGKTTDGIAKRVYVEEVNDDLDTKYNYNSIPGKAVQTVKTISNESKTSGEVTLDPVIETIHNDDGTITEKKYIKKTGWEALASQESTTITYTATAIIGNNEEDLLYTNKAKIKAIRIDKYATLNTESAEERHWPDDKTKFTITPSTGGNRNETYLIVETIALAIIIAGIILIKKKVL